LALARAEDPTVVAAYTTHNAYEALQYG